jgi:hypothetical protein
MNWGQVLAGAGTGAAVGSVVPGVGTAIGAIGGGLAGLFESGAQDQAAQAQLSASREATQLQRDQWEAQQRNQAPWIAAGQSALPELSRLAGSAGNISATADPGYRQLTGLTNPGQFSFNTTGANADPSYTWRLNQGLAGVNNSAAARGGFFSGNTGTALTDYSQGAASQEYQAQFGRYQTGLQDYMQQENFNSDQYNQAYNRQLSTEQNQYNQFASIAGIGQTALTNVNNAGSNFASNVGNLAVNQGNNTANTAVNQGNILSNVVGNTANQFSSAWPDIWKSITTPTNYGSQQFGPAF